LRSGARLRHLALAREQQRAPSLYFERPLRVVDARQSGFGGGKVAALFSGLGQQQPGLGEVLVRRTAVIVVVRVVRSRRCRLRLRQLHEALQRLFGRLRLLQFELQRAQRQPRSGHLGLLLGDDLQLRDRIGVTLHVDQRAGIGAPQQRVGLGGPQVLGDDAFGLGPHAHQFQRQQHRRAGIRLLRLRLACQCHRPLDIASGQPAAADGHLRSCARVASADIRLQHLFDQGGGLALVGGAAHETRHRANDCRTLGRGRAGDQRAHRLGQVLHAVHRQQDLQLQAQRFQRLGPRRAPGTRGRQGLLASSGLQCDLGRTPEQLLVARAPRSVQHDLVGIAGLAGAELDLADQQLVEQRRIDGRVEHRRCGRGLAGSWGGRRGRLGRRCVAQEHEGRTGDPLACG
jgi:hypothetical protein